MKTLAQSTSLWRAAAVAVSADYSAATHCWFTCAHPQQCSRCVFFLTNRSHLHEPGLIPGTVTPRFSHVGIVSDDAAGWLVFSGISHFPRPCIPALLHTHLTSPSSALQDLGCYEPHLMGWGLTLGLKLLCAVHSPLHHKQNASHIQEHNTQHCEGIRPRHVVVLPVGHPVPAITSCPEYYHCDRSFLPPPVGVLYGFLLYHLPPKRCAVIGCQVPPPPTTVRCVVIGRWLRGTRLAKLLQETFGDFVSPVF
ncbi:hypothetical protein PR048_028190 [Dryococelus australis]|uniref:Secreted protein n=1 Tax=Dryococelus australis TaxID=614101 RepID=A0ABQ9GIK2_9NEOP|nr:hypothetical protein PR048_028190 [Dryococelus australis]